VKRKNFGHEQAPARLVCNLLSSKKEATVRTAQSLTHGQRIPLFRPLKGELAQPLADLTRKYARINGLRTVWLSVELGNRSAIRVYKKHGFQVSDTFGPEQKMTVDLQEESENEVCVHEPAA
jgi:hypothetical protein